MDPINAGPVLLHTSGEEVISVSDETAHGGDLSFNLYLAGGRGTEFPDAAVLGELSMAKFAARSLWLREIGDGIDIALSSAMGTREAPTALTGTFLPGSMYGAPWDGTNFLANNANRYFPTSTAYLRRIAEINVWSAQTPTQFQGWGAVEITTANGTQTPISREVFRPDGKVIHYANAFELSGIFYPFPPGDIWQSRMPIPGINWKDYQPDAGNTFIAGDISGGSDRKVIAIRSLAAPYTEGISLGLHRSDQELVFYRRWGTTEDSKWLTVVLSSGVLALGHPNTLTPGREALRIVPRANATTSIAVTAGNPSNTAKIDLVTSAADAGLDINAKGAGAVRLRNGAVTLGAGVQVGAPSGGDMGAGTLNLDNGLYRDGLQVVGPRLPPIPNATSANVVETLNAALAALRAHGLTA